MIHNHRYDEDMAAVQHAAKRAVETLIPLMYEELNKYRSERSQGLMPMATWLGDGYLTSRLNDSMASYFTQEFRKLQAVIESDDEWVEKEIARFFKDKLGLATVELRVLGDRPRFREVNYMPINKDVKHLQPSFA